MSWYKKFRILFKCLTFNITVKQQNYNIVDVQHYKMTKFIWYNSIEKVEQENPWTLAFDETEELLLPGERGQLN